VGNWHGRSEVNEGAPERSVGTPSGYSNLEIVGRNRAHATGAI
jgi:hypothetical protein